jgi:hypothetical protein
MTVMSCCPIIGTVYLQRERTNEGRTRQVRLERLHEVTSISVHSSLVSSVPSSTTVTQHFSYFFKDYCKNGTVLSKAVIISHITQEPYQNSCLLASKQRAGVVLNAVCSGNFYSRRYFLHCTSELFKCSISVRFNALAL